MQSKLTRGSFAFVVVTLLTLGCEPGERPVSQDPAVTVGRSGSSMGARATAPTTNAPPAPLPRTDEQSLDELLEKLVPRAAGVALVEVAETEEVDMRPGCGNLELRVRFRVLRKTGDVADNISIVKAFGGLRPHGSPTPKHYGPVKLDTFEKGKRYWVAFSSRHDWRRYPQRVVESWPELARPELLERAVDTDHYRDRPQYDPETGLTHGDLPGDDGKSTRVRMERDGAPVWEVNVPGVMDDRSRVSNTWRFVHRSHSPMMLQEADGAGWFLMMEMAVDLPAGNEFSLAPRKYRVLYLLDAETGRTASVRVSRFDNSPESTAMIVRYFDPTTKAIKREIRSANQ